MAITDARLVGLSEAEPGPERRGDVERARLREVERHLRGSSPSCTSAIPDYVSRRVRAVLICVADPDPRPTW